MTDEMAITERPPPPDSGGHFEEVSRHDAVLKALSELRGELQAFRDEYRRDKSGHQQTAQTVDRMSQQIAAMTSREQVSRFEADGGNGLSGCSVLLVEDEQELGEALERWLKRRGVSTVSWQRTAEDAIRVVDSLSQDQAPTHAIIDVKLGSGYGVDVARRCRDRHPNTVRILYTGFTDESLPRGVADFAIYKPFDASQLAAILKGEAQ